MIVYNGATGGLGRHLGPHLESRGARHRSLETRLERSGDLGDELTSVVGGTGAHVVSLVHMAAMVSVPACEADPDRARAVNVDGAAAYVSAFVDWAGAAGVEASVVYVSTGHVYAPPLTRQPLTEEAAVGPRSVYAATKLAGESAVAAATGASAVSLTVARVFGLLAPGQAAGYLLPALIDRVRRGDVASIPGLGNVRDYLDARDVVAHLADLGERPDSDRRTRVLNVCSGVGVAVADVLAAVIDEMLGTGSREGAALEARVIGAPPRPTDVPWLVGCPNRLVETTGRRAQTIPLSTTVRDAILAA